MKNANSQNSSTTTSTTSPSTPTTTGLRRKRKKLCQSPSSSRDQLTRSTRVEAMSCRKQQLLEKQREQQRQRILLLKQHKLDQLTLFLKQKEEEEQRLQQQQLERNRLLLEKELERIEKEREAKLLLQKRREREQRLLIIQQHKRTQQEKQKDVIVITDDEGEDQENTTKISIDQNNDHDEELEEVFVLIDQMSDDDDDDDDDDSEQDEKEEEEDQNQKKRQNEDPLVVVMGVERDVDITFITFEKLPHLCDDDFILLAQLKKQYPSLTIEVVVWSKFINDHEIRNYFQRVKLVIIRSTWDYQENPEKFMKWLRVVNESALKVLNSYEAIEWNIHKQYLKQLSEEYGVNIVPTCFFNGEYTTRVKRASQLQRIAQGNGWSQVILKPCKSAGSENVIKFEIDELDCEDVMDIIESGSPYMMQKYLPSVLTFGELSLVYFNGQLSSAIQKKLQDGNTFDWSVHVPVENPSVDALQMAKYSIQSALNCIQKQQPPQQQQQQQQPTKNTTANNLNQLYPLLYARVDLLQDVDGSLLLSELELFEPTFFLQYLPQDRQVYLTNYVASVIARWLHSLVVV